MFERNKIQKLLLEFGSNEKFLVSRETITPDVNFVYRHIFINSSTRDENS